ncbi:AMP-binding protein [Dethiosulfovibrio sp. F2B]|uniref:AMP-binding protein n=1 Tax=Dethiosulfovibrio faecalis TaxID=2720018 RepID=UPI001F32474D|nr:AMP-binding protein [Dethiosulfovibrio faecalis]MCF4152593.1 AMP-binding protein [Dethiosulfovibrio faecalis]
MEGPSRIENRVSEVWNDGDPVLWWNGDWMTAGRLFEMADGSQKVLSDGGFRRGDRLMVLMPNCPALLALSIACWRLGGTVVPVNLQAGQEALLSSIDAVEPCAIVVEGSLKGSFSSLLESSVPVFPVGLEAPLGEFRGIDVPTSEDHVALLFSTSGTTGRPKVVPVSHENVLSDMDQALKQVSEISDGEVFLNVLPNFHTLGFIVSGLLPLLFRFRQVILPSFMPVDRTLKAIEASGVTAIVAVPTMLRFMVAAGLRAGMNFPSVRLVISGGDRFSVDLDSRVEKVFGVPVLEGYGLTECSPILAVNPSYEARKLGTVGPVLGDLEWQIRGLDGEVKEEGEEGVLWVKGPSVVSRYFRNPEVSVEKFVDGWFNTGDVVSMDGDGYVRIMDRAGDMIIVGGFNVYPQEVEAVLASYAGVREAAVVGKKNSFSGQIPYGYVILDPEASVTSAELISYCKGHLAHYKVPRKIEMVEDFPRNSLGKVLRRALRDDLNRGTR